jgi:hypothetical protein
MAGTSAERPDHGAGGFGSFPTMTSAASSQWSMNTAGRTAVVVRVQSGHPIDRLDHLQGAGGGVGDNGTHLR